MSTQKSRVLSLWVPDFLLLYNTDGQGNTCFWAHSKGGMRHCHPGALSKCEPRVSSLSLITGGTAATEKNKTVLPLHQLTDGPDL